jgi:hypothetical protein
MPFLFVLYVFNYLNRVNVGYAALQMRGDLGFSNTVFGLGAGIFFIGYFLLQIPSTLLTELWSARLFITLSLIVWGGLAAACGLIDTAGEFYWRFLGRRAGAFPASSSTDALVPLSGSREGRGDVHDGDSNREHGRRGDRRGLDADRLARLERLAVAAHSRRAANGGVGRHRVLLSHGSPEGREMAAQ